MMPRSFKLEQALTRRDLLKLLALAPVAAFVACGPRRPEPIRYNEETCEYCQMGISDPRYGSEIITNTGKIHKFDSVECMVAYGLKNLGPEKIQSRWVTDFEAPKTFIAAESAYYLQSSQLRSPMIVGLTAFATEASLELAQQAFEGSKLRFEDLERVVREARFV